MQSVYALNNLPFWSEEAIEQRAFLAQRFHSRLEAKVRERNRAWLFERIEAPMLIPRELLNLEYSDDALFTIAPRMSSLRLAFAQAMAAESNWYARLSAKNEQLPPLNERVRKLIRDASTDDHLASTLPAWLDVWVKAWAQESRMLPVELVLRPETTPATYAWMSKRLELQASLPPYCCWQLNKSFRREQDQPTKHMRLKEFWQQEFQMLYTSDSHEDWHAFVVEPVRDIIAELTRCPTRIVVSDRLPAYSVLTIDIEVWNSEKWMEICSISKRLDFPVSYVLSKKADVQREALVCEVATSPDRQYYCLERWQEAWTTLNASTELQAEYKDHAWRDAVVSNANAAAARTVWKMR